MHFLWAMALLGLHSFSISEGLRVVPLPLFPVLQESRLPPIRSAGPEALDLGQLWVESLWVPAVL